jgi:hypothetical protein
MRASRCRPGAAEFAYLIHDTDADVTDTIDYIADR